MVTSMLLVARSRRSALVTATLVAALAMSGCGADTSDAPGDSPGTTGTTQATATSTSDAAAPASDPTGPDGETPLIDSEPADTVALALSERLAEVLASATDEFGDVDVDLLQLDPDSTSLHFVDPAEPDTRSRSERLDATWSSPVGSPRPGPQPLLPLDAIDPDVLRGAIEAAPIVLDTGLSRLSHVSVSPDEGGRAEYLVALAFGTSLGRVTFDASGQVREVKPFM